MIFHEIYSVYYQTVAKILEEALDHPLKQDEICNIIEKYAFSESILSIESALREQKWQLLNQMEQRFLRMIHLCHLQRSRNDG